MTQVPAPIGVFDSGMGGLTVLRALQQSLPGESFVYLGDTARLPYGSKSPATVERYALQAADILINRGIRALVVACNTASAFALSALKKRHSELPIFGVVEPGAEAAAESAPGASILVLATESTVLGGAYQKALLARRPDLKVHARACPLLVALAEEGEHDGEFTASVLRHYLHGHVEGGSVSRPATIVLGCTHFPVFRTALHGLVDDSTVRIVDSAETTASKVAAALQSNGADGGCLTLLATDGEARFKRVGSYFLGAPIDAVELVDL
ncbi:MAG: glutamate racemase [Gammaproteobacteria bacterium]|jgi:glutamate racemase